MLAEEGNSFLNFKPANNKIFLDKITHIEKFTYLSIIFI